MKVQFVVSTKRKNIDAGLQEHETEMLMLTKLVGIPLGAGPKAIDEVTNGLLTQRMEAVGFRGELDELLSIQLGAEHRQKNILLVGLGKPTRFDQCTLASVAEAAVAQAIKDGCHRLSVPVVAHRLTALNLNLKGTAFIVRQAAERVLSTIESDETFTVEFICTPQAKRHIDEGLTIQCRRQRAACCKTKIA
jgi:hypothetical protein